MVNTQHIIIILKYGNSVRITHIHKTYYNSFRVNELTKGSHKLTGQNQHRLGNIAGTVKHSHVTHTTHKIIYITMVNTYNNFIILKYGNSARKIRITHIYKTIIINYNTSRITKLTKGGYKLSTCHKH